MRIRWRLPLRSFSAILLVAIVLLVLALGLLGWQLLDQNRALEQEQIRQRLSAAVDLAADSLRRGFLETEGRLTAFASAPGSARHSLVTDFAVQNDDALVVVTASDDFWSSMPLPFYPDQFQPDPVDGVAAAFGEAERVELAGRDLPAALAAYMRLTAAASPEVRAGAWLRTARVARTLNRPRDVMAAYEQLSKLGSVPAAGRPSDLVAAFERGNYLAQQKQKVLLGKAAADFQSALKAGRWRLTRGAYLFYLDEVQRWLGQLGSASPGQTPTATLPVTLADGLARAWRDVPGFSSRGVPNGREVIDTGHTPVVIMWRRSADRLAVLVATPTYVERVWLRDVGAIENRQRARVMVMGGTDLVLRGPFVDGPTTARRAPADLAPLQLAVASSDPAGDEAMFSSRRWLQAGLITTLGLLLLVGGFVVARGASRELETARLQSDFVSAVSHEFRTPVAALRQLSELLDEGRVTDDERRVEYYRLLRRESERLQRLVEGLLDFGRMESAAKEYRFDDIQLSTFLPTLVDEFAAEASRGGHRVSLSVASGLPSIRGDAEAIGRAVWNLLDNAAKYSPAGTAIDVDVRAAANSQDLAIHVRDQGPGVAPEERVRIFDKFVRGSSARASGAKGTGLGLAMVARIVRAHGGDVQVGGAPGGGAEFSLVLPAIEPQNDAAPGQSAASSVPVRK